MDVPFDIEKSEIWFIQLWNYTVIPYLSDLLKEKFFEEASNHSDLFEEPTETVLNKYPWTMTKNSKISISERLHKLKSSNENCIDSQISEDGGNSANKNNHRLVSRNPENIFFKLINLIKII